MTPSELVEIEECAFHTSAVVSFTVPRTVKYIGPQAFAACAHLAQLKIDPHGQLIAIGPGAFFQCPLTKVAFPRSLRFIGAGAIEKTCNVDLGNVEWIEMLREWEERRICDDEFELNIDKE
jgi:hypothetical protein